MGDIINLRQARKAKSRKDAASAAASNRAAYGRTKAEKANAVSDRLRRDAVLDGAAIARGPDGQE